MAVSRLCLWSRPQPCSRGKAPSHIRRNTEKAGNIYGPPKATGSHRHGTRHVVQCPCSFFACHLDFSAALGLLPAAAAAAAATTETGSSTDGALYAAACVVASTILRAARSVYERAPTACHAKHRVGWGFQRRGSLEPSTAGQPGELWK